MAHDPLPVMTFDQLTDYMRDEMARNAISSDAMQIKRFNQAGLSTLRVNLDLGQHLPVLLRAPVAAGSAAAAQVTGSAAAMALWASKVAGGKDWDHKGRIVKNNRWVTDGALQYQFDIWSNIHYGFVGRAVGFSAWTLKSGAGGAQIMDKTVPPGYWDRRFKTIGDADFLSAFDDPADQAAIILGMDLFDAKGIALTANDLRTMVRSRAGSLSTKAAATTP